MSAITLIIGIAALAVARTIVPRMRNAWLWLAVEWTVAVTVAVLMHVAIRAWP